MITSDGLFLFKLKERRRKKHTQQIFIWNYFSMCVHNETDCISIVVWGNFSWFHFENVYLCFIYYYVFSSSRCSVGGGEKNKQKIFFVSTWNKQFWDWKWNNKELKRIYLVLVLSTSQTFLFTIKSKVRMIMIFVNAASLLLWNLGQCEQFYLILIINFRRIFFLYVCKKQWILIFLQLVRFIFFLLLTNIIPHKVRQSYNNKRLGSPILCVFWSGPKIAFPSNSV